MAITTNGAPEVTANNTVTLTNKTLTAPTISDPTFTGTTTNINTTNLVVEDKNIVINDVTSPTDVNADGGGISLNGDTTKTLNWVDATDAWTSSENLNLLTTKTFKIAGTDVLTATEVLGKSVPSGDIVGTSDSQTLTNKTLTTPVISSITNTGTLTLPTSTDTLVGRATTDTLTNKTLTTPVISSITNTGTLTLPTTTGTIALTSDITVSDSSTTTFTNKSISLATNTVTATLAELNTAISDADIASLAGSETLTNKTLTTPIISSISNTGTVTLPTATDTLVGRDTTDTLTNKTLTAPAINDATTNYPTLKAPTETANIVAAAATGTIDIDVETSTIWHYTTDASANHTLNFRYNSGTTLATKLAVGEAITIVWITPNGATAYYPNVIQIDGSTVTPKVQGGTAITAGNVSATDIYSFTIIKTAATPTYLVLEAQTKFA
jgi:hypothetical protein